MVVVVPASHDVATLARVGQLPCHLRRDFPRSSPFLPTTTPSTPSGYRRYSSHRRIHDSPGLRPTNDHLSEVTAKRRVTGFIDRLQAQAIVYFSKHTKSTYPPHSPSCAHRLRYCLDCFAAFSRAWTTGSALRFVIRETGRHLPKLPLVECLVEWMRCQGVLNPKRSSRFISLAMPFIYAR